MRNYFTLDGVDSRTFGVYISGQGTFNAPVRDIDFIQIPGRNGDLIGLPTRLENGEYSYNDAFIYADFKNKIAAFKAFLLSKPGYRRLIDTYHPTEYRLVAYRGGLDVDPTTKNNAGKFDIVFAAKPQRYLLSGDTAVSLSASGTINNPTLFDALPLVRVYGAGVLTINGTDITISEANTYTDIDFESGYAYNGTDDRNAYVSLDVNDFPALIPGDNAITLGTGITRVDVTPRWWTV